MGAERKSAVLSEENRRLTAYHEAGHALVALKSNAALPIHKATIMPRGSALGMVTQLPDKDETSVNRKQLMAKLDVCMGGRLAEELIFGPDEVTTGASGDLQQATRLAFFMISDVGMNSSLGPVHLSSIRGGNSARGASGSTESAVDGEVIKLLKESQTRVQKLLKSNLGDLHTIAKALMEKETPPGMKSARSSVCRPRRSRYRFRRARNRRLLNRSPRNPRRRRRKRRKKPPRRMKRRPSSPCFDKTKIRRTDQTRLHVYDMTTYSTITACRNC